MQVVVHPHMELPTRVLAVVVQVEQVVLITPAHHLEEVLVDMVFSV
tara:strand:- start:221 stop:358 length:138 start_codon:yes stop_codon:yes gene_type:complete